MQSAFISVLRMRDKKTIQHAYTHGWRKRLLKFSQERYAGNSFFLLALPLFAYFLHACVCFGRIVLSLFLLLSLNVSYVHIYIYLFIYFASFAARNV